MRIAEKLTGLISDVINHFLSQFLHRYRQLPICESDFWSISFNARITTPSNGCLCHPGLGGRESRLVYYEQMTPGSCNDHQRTLTSVRVKELHCRIVFWNRMAWMGLLPAGGDSILWFSAEFFGSRMNSYSREAKQEDPSKNSFCGDVCEVRMSFLFGTRRSFLIDVGTQNSKTSVCRPGSYRWHVEHRGWNLTGKVLFCKKTLKIRLFWHFFTYNTTLRGVFRPLSFIIPPVILSHAYIIHMSYSK